MIYCRQISRLFGILDFILWTCVTILVTGASFFVINNRVEFGLTLYVVGAWVLLIVVLYICYLTIAASIGLIKATSGKPGEPSARIKLCKFWLNVSWTSFVWALVVFLFFGPHVGSSHAGASLVQIVHIVLRGLALRWVNRYVHELKSVSHRPSNFTESLTPLAWSVPCAVSQTNDARNAVEDGLPSYEDVMLKDMYENTSPPPYDDICIVK